MSMKKKALDNFLDACGHSPVKKTLTCTWESSSERTKTDYMVKAEKIFHDILSVLAPGQERNVMSSILEKLNHNKHQNMIEIVASAYHRCKDWGTQRQILSIIADKFTLAEIQKCIPELTRYKFTAARKHALQEEHGKQVVQPSQHREKLTNQQISHFLDFIMSPTIMTDAPYGIMNLKLSSGDKMEVPKIILNSVRSRVIDQYLQYCKENEFNQEASHRLYMRILEAVDPNIRKSMKGLDNYAAEGAKGFEDLIKVLSVMESVGKDDEWVEEKKSPYQWQNST